MTSLPIAFYAPLKSPHHPSPSGDRTMARLLLRALAQAGFSPQLASELRTWDRTGNSKIQADLELRSDEAAARLIESYRALPPSDRPRLWFTYHVYYKAPDWIGPQIAQALRIPYVIAEGSRASKRAEGPWSLGHRGAEAALDHARIVLVMTSQDRKALEIARPAGQTLVDLPPFLDCDDWGNAASAVVKTDRAVPKLLTVAMMRDGDKLTSYGILAQALDQLDAMPWSLDIVGDGEAWESVRELFAPFGSRVCFHGRIDDKVRLRHIYEEADLFLWPAVNEAYGMVFLEAQLFGCPVVAGAYGGVASVIQDTTTGILTKPGDADAFAKAVAALLPDQDLRRRMGGAAAGFVARERSLTRAAACLRETLLPVVESGSSP